MRYRYRKQYEWTPELAYVAGLLTADGCLSSDGRHINLTTTDTELVVLAIEILNLETQPSRKRSGHNSLGYHLQFSDVSLYDFLMTAGLTPAKSLTINKVIVPEQFFPDYLRGYFDGDGSIYAFFDKRWKNSTMFYTAFTSASYPFLAWLKAEISTFTGIRSGTIGSYKERRISLLRYAKADTRRLFEFMYYNSGVPCLSRKYLKFIDLFTSNRYDIEVLRASGGMVDTLV